MNNPLVSVVIPVYNVEQYIAQCLDSVLSQTYSNIEIIIVDDGGPDQSMAVVERYSDHRLRVINQENRGLAGARNTGIRAAQGELIALLDSDDYWAKDKIEKHVTVMLNNENCGLSFSSSLFINEQGESLHRLQRPINKNNFDSSVVFCRNPIGNGSVPIIRRSILDKIAFTSTDKEYIQYFDESLRQSEDIDCWIRIALQTKTTFEFLDEPLTYYRLNSGGLSANVDGQFKTWERVLEKVTTIAPEFAQKYGKLAKAYQYRYLARRLILEGNTFKACKLILKALVTSPKILLKEPKRTLATVGASFGLTLLPLRARRKAIEFAL